MMNNSGSYHPDFEMKRCLLVVSVVPHVCCTSWTHFLSVSARTSTSPTTEGNIPESFYPPGRSGTRLRIEKQSSQLRGISSDRTEQ